jgi:hypothetical protein
MMISSPIEGIVVSSIKQRYTNGTPFSPQSNDFNWFLILMVHPVIPVVLGSGTDQS